MCVQHSIKNISRNAEAVFLKLAPEMNITKETKLQLSCRCHDNSYAAGPVLITTNIPRFHFSQGSSTPNNLVRRVKTMWEPCLICSEEDPLSHSRRLQIPKWRYFVFSQKETGAKGVATAVV